MSYKRLVCDIGINDADYPVSSYVNGKQLLCPIYKKWKSMLVRCYDTKYQSRYNTYLGCTVDERWHSFMAFREWVLAQPQWEGLHLDKDLLVYGNKVYGPDTCLFVSAEVNKFLVIDRVDNGKLPIGVASINNKYIAQVSCFGGKRWASQLVETQEDAAALYWNKKLELAKLLSIKQSNPIVAIAIVQFIETRLNEIRR